MEELGYQAKGENGMLFRRFFHKKEPDVAYNIHVYEVDNSEISRHLAFRDYLRIHPDVCRAYENLKQDLAQKYPHDMLQYCFGKESFVQKVEAKADCQSTRIVEALTPREWETVKRFRQHYFFDLISIQDPFVWTFTDALHRHLVLYENSEIVGYAHIQLWKDKRATISRYFVIGISASL